MTDLREQLMESAVAAYKEKGLHFTMQELAESLHISKKTIYTVYQSKEDLFLDLLDTGFAAIQKQKMDIIASDRDLLDKIREVMIALPDTYSMLDFRLLADLQEKYPAAHASLKRHLEGDWEPVIGLLEKGIREGVIRGISIPVLRIMVTASIESFTGNTDLETADISYQEALDYMMDIIMKGIANEENQ